VEGTERPGQDPLGQHRISGLSATTKINPGTSGVWNSARSETGGLLVGEDVNITLDVQFVRGEVPGTAARFLPDRFRAGWEKKWCGWKHTLLTLDRHQSKSA